MEPQPWDDRNNDCPFASGTKCGRRCPRRIVGAKDGDAEVDFQRGGGDHRYRREIRLPHSAVAELVVHSVLPRADEIQNGLRLRNAGSLEGPAHVNESLRVEACEQRVQRLTGSLAELLMYKYEQSRNRSRIELSM